MFRRTRKVLLALSGGPDSVATLLVLRELGSQLGFEVEACHFDHQLRPESHDDTARVRAICEALGVECVTGEGDVRGVAKQMKRGIEDMAREMRYQFLAFVAEKKGCDAIATGHTRDDQAETVLMRVIRGSGVRGLRGMLPVSTVPGANAQRLLRPMLETSRAATETICEEFGIQPIHDESNSDITIRRNKVRHQVLPALQELNPSVSGALIGLAASAREAFDPVEKASLEVQPRERGSIGAVFQAANVGKLPAEALGLVIEREASFYHLRPELNRTRLENLLAVLGKGRGQVRFGDTVVEASSGLVRLGPVLEPATEVPPTVVSLPGDTRAGDWVVRVRTEPLDGDANSPVAAVDSSTVHGVLKLRSLAPGDRIEIRGVTRKVSDFLVNQKVPAWERSTIVVLADLAGLVALFSARGTFVRDGANPDLWVKLSAIAPR